MARNNIEVCKAFTLELVSASLQVLETSLGKSFSERQKGILLMYVSGETFQAIANKYACTPTYAQKVVRGLKQKMMEFDSEYYVRYSSLEEQVQNLQRELGLLRHVKSVLHDKKPVIGVLLEDCEFPRRLMNALKANYPSVRTLQDLSCLSKSQLRSAKGIGRNMIQFIQDRLAAFGMTLL